MLYFPIPKDRSTHHFCCVCCISTHAFFYLVAICRLSWNGTCVTRLLDNHHVNTSVDVLKFKTMILLKPVLGGVDGRLHLPLPSMNRLSQTEPTTIVILLLWAAFFRDSFSVTCFITKTKHLLRSAYCINFIQLLYMYNALRTCR